MAFQRRKSAAFKVRARFPGFVEPALASPIENVPSGERKAQLKRLIGKTAIQFTDSFEIDGPAMFKHACRIGLEPSLLAEIEYRAKSAEGKLRHPFFKGIREDM
jgi:ATP-dependent DNA ligase